MTTTENIQDSFSEEQKLIEIGFKNQKDLKIFDDNFNFEKNLEIIKQEEIKLKEELKKIQKEKNKIQKLIDKDKKQD